MNAVHVTGVEKELWDKLWFLTGILIRKGQACTPLELCMDCYLLKLTSEEVEALCYFPDSPLSMTDSGKVTFSHLAFSFFDNIKDCYDKPSSPFIWQAQPSTMDILNSYLQETHFFSVKAFARHFWSLPKICHGLPLTDHAGPRISGQFGISSPPANETGAGAASSSVIHLPTPCAISGLRNILLGSLKHPNYSLHHHSEMLTSGSNPTVKESILSQITRKRSREEQCDVTFGKDKSKIPKVVTSERDNVDEASDHANEGDAEEMHNAINLPMNLTGVDNDSPTSLSSSEYDSRRSEQEAHLCVRMPLNSVVDTGLKASNGEVNTKSVAVDANCFKKDKDHGSFMASKGHICVKSSFLESASALRHSLLSTTPKDEVRLENICHQDQGVELSDKHGDHSKPEVSLSLEVVTKENAFNVHGNFSPHSTSKSFARPGLDDDVRISCTAIDNVAKENSCTKVSPIMNATGKEGPILSIYSNIITLDGSPHYLCYDKEEKQEELRIVCPAVGQLDDDTVSHEQEALIEGKDKQIVTSEIHCVPMHQLSPEEDEEAAANVCSPSDLQVVDSSQKGGENSDKKSRHPKWSKQEILIFLHAKRHVDEQVADASSRKAITTSCNKWDLVSVCCLSHGVERSACECMKKWNNLCTDYKKIREYEDSNCGQSYWLMSWGTRKDLKLNPNFDHEIYDMMESFFGRRQGINETLYETSATPVHASLFPSFESIVLEGGGSDTNKLGSGETTREDLPTFSVGRKRKKEGFNDDELKERLVASLDATRATLTSGLGDQFQGVDAQASSQNNMDSLDKEKENGKTENMAFVLGKLVNSLGEIAKKL